MLFFLHQWFSLFGANPSFIPNVRKVQLQKKKNISNIIPGILCCVSCHTNGMFSYSDFVVQNVSDKLTFMSFVFIFLK